MTVSARDAWLSRRWNVARRTPRLVWWLEKGARPCFATRRGAQVAVDELAR